MDWSIGVSVELGTAGRAARVNPKDIALQLEKVETRIKVLEAKLDAKVLVGLRAGFRHLIDGMSSSIPKVREDELVMARREFNRLSSLDPRSSIITENGEISNKALICLGYFGNFYYFLMRDDERSSAIQVYECGAKYGNFAIRVFPPYFFSKPYEELLAERGVALRRATTLLEKRESANLWDSLKYHAIRTGRVIASGAVGLAGVVGGALTITFHIPAGLALMFGGVRAASDIFESAKKEELILEDVETPRDDAERLRREIAGLWKELEVECETRRNELQTMAVPRSSGPKGRKRASRKP